MNLLLYHVVPGTNAVSFTLQDGPLETLSGAELTVQTGSSGITVDHAKVVDPDVIASNGIIHVIDEVLIPDDLVVPGGKPPNRSTPKPTDDPFLPPVQSPGGSKVPTYAPTSGTLEPGQTYAPTKDTPIPTYSPTEGPPDVQVPPNTIGKKKKKDKDKEDGVPVPTYRPTEPWPTYSPTTLEIETMASGGAGALRSYFAAQGPGEPASAGYPPSWSPTSSTYYPTVSTEQPTSGGHARNLHDHSPLHWDPRRGLAGAATVEEWASVPPNDEFFERFPEWRARQEEIYRLRSRGRSKPDNRRRRLDAPDAQYYDLEWSDLPANIQSAYSALGYNEEYWCYGGGAPASESMGWADLSPVMQGAARALGYNQVTWDREVGITEDGDAISIEDIGIGEEEGGGDGQVASPIPNQLVSAQFLEIDTSMNMNIINQDDQYINVTFPPNPDGDSVTDFTLSFTSVSATLDPSLPLEDQADLLPGGVILILIARTSGGEVLRNRVFWTYTMGCGLEDVTIRTGDEFAWTAFVSPMCLVVTLGGKSQPRTNHRPQC